MHHSDLAYVLRLGRQGFDPDLIYSRIMERLVWHGAVPSPDEIRGLLVVYGITKRAA